MSAAHGTQYGYTAGCRCDECRAAAAAYQRGLRERSRQPCPLCDHAVSSAAGLRRHLRAKHSPEERLLIATRPVFDLDAVNCAGQHEAMFPATAAEVDEAKAICVGCPVAVQCLTWALSNGETVGVWGGVNLASRDERREARRRFR